MTMDYFEQAGNQSLVLYWKGPGMVNKQGVAITRYFRIGQPASVAPAGLRMPKATSKTAILFDVHGRRLGVSEFRSGASHGSLRTGCAVFVAVAEARDSRACRPTLVVR
jgi:hypothetical protein